jgi:hypothetical protein
MTPRVHRLVRLLAVVGATFVASVSSRATSADPATDDARRVAEEAFVVGRLQDLDAILGSGTTATDAEPFFVRDGIWRPTRIERTPPPDDGSLSSRRIRWIVEAFVPRKAGLDAYPLPNGDEADPYPRITALVRDRARRESVGLAGLPEASPLAAVPDEMIRWLGQRFAHAAFPDSVRPSDTAEDRQAAREAAHARSRVEDLAARNRLLAIAAVGGIVLAAIAAGALLARAGRVRKAPPAATDL